jgi:hypothetical protein
LKNFLTNIFKDIIWHLFAGESQQVVKITVPSEQAGEILKNNLHNKHIPSKGESKSVTTHWLQNQPCCRTKTK